MKKVIGKASSELVERYRVLDLEAIAMNDAVKEFTSAIHKMGRAGMKTAGIKRAYEKAIEAFKERQEATRAAIWDAIYAELKIDPSGEYRINAETGEIALKGDRFEEVLEAIGIAMPRGECDCDECKAEREKRASGTPSGTLLN